MARRRFISNGIWTNPKFVACSVPARLLFVGLVTNADDGGRLTGNPTEVRLMVFPADRFTDAKVSGLIDELAGVRLVHHYSVNGDSFIEIPKFGQHQDSRYVKQSLLPPFRGLPAKSSDVTDLPDSASIGQQVDDHVDVDVYDHVDVLTSPPARGVSARGTQETKAQRPRASASSSASEFAQFWQQYPRKVGKRKAEDAYRRAKHRDGQSGFLQRVLGAIARQKQSRQWLADAGRYIPHPATWLNGDRWEDAVDADPLYADELAPLRLS